MPEYFLIFIFILIIIIMGNNHMIRIVCGVIVGLLIMGIASKEKFTIVKTSSPVIEQPVYTNYVQYNPELRNLDDMMVRKNLHTGRQAETIHRGQIKNRVNYLRPMFEEDLDYNESVDWWNEDAPYY